LGTIPWTLQGYDISTEMVLSIGFLISLVWHEDRASAWYFDYYDFVSNVYAVK
jgi:hypothetical protein